MKHSVRCGVDRADILADYVKGKRVALLTAASGVDRQGIPTYEVIRRLGGELCILLTPEHGLYSALQEGRFGDGEAAHPDTGARMYSLGAVERADLPQLLETVDLAVYDLQDVGARYYTYLCNLTQLMRACRAAGKPLLVLDRPDPLGGRHTEGLLLDESRFSTFVGEFSIPTRYGLTVGEYAAWANAERKIGCELYVLPCAGLARDMYMDETDLLWVNPSPNIPAVSTCFNYIGSCLYEASNLSEGRGTTRPFDWIGAPFVREQELWRQMTALGLPGVTFRPICFLPLYSKHAGTVCRGLELHVTDRETYRPFRTALYMLRYLKEYPETELRRTGLAHLVGQDLLFEDYDPEDILRREAEGCRIFGENVAKYRVYPGSLSDNRENFTYTAQTP